MGGETGDADVDAYGAGCVRHGHVDFTGSLDRDKPLACAERYRGVAHVSQHLPAVAVPEPAERGQEDSAIVLIELDLLRVRVTEAIALTFLLETGGTPRVWRRNSCTRAPCL